MQNQILAALAAFAFVSSITPGPNNLMLLASGANFGIRRTMPHMIGVAGGFTLMIAIVGFGLSGLFTAFPIAQTILKAASVAFLVYMAWRLANAGQPKSVEADARPLRLWQAAAFQWINPKAWAMALTALSAYAPDRSLTGVIWVSLVFGMVNLPCIAIWAGLGTQMRRWLSNPRRLRIFNWAMAGLLLATLIPILMH